MESVEKLELHYHLKDQSHSMDALIRNRCEAEALAAFLEIAKSLGITVSIETSAYTEGGLREIWDFIGKNNNQLTLLLAIVVLIFSRVPVAPVSDAQMDNLNKEIAKLTLEEKRLAIEKLKQELKENNVSKETLNTGAAAIQENVKIAVRRSNFYKNLVEYGKVTGVGISPVIERDIENYVDKSEFHKFVLSTNNLPVEIVEPATIEIVAPVLKEGNYQWKGIYQGELISFSMADDEFKFSVLARQVSFQHGSVIECVLKINRRFDAVGDIVITGYSVSVVLSVSDGENKNETLQGARHKAYKKFLKDQGELF
ncbi:hypothetical protein [Chitinimonas sp.]|uniref:hypothetical protein n=1 Tax=Chitinimonas sp. TaxID=1934313 RepID=UPI002F92B16A